jgi:hypothetical protein
VSPEAQKWGLKTGDQITALNGEKVDNLMGSFMNPEFLTNSRKELTLTRDNKTVTVTLPDNIENSFSMSSIGANGNLLSESKEQARKIIENTSANTQVLLVTNALSGIEQKTCTKSDALNRLDKIQFSPLTHPLSEVVQWMEETVDENIPSSYSKQFVVLTDFQKNQSDLKNIHVAKSSYFYPIQLIPEQKNNVSIESKKSDFFNKLL